MNFDPKNKSVNLVDCKIWFFIGLSSSSDILRKNAHKLFQLFYVFQLRISVLLLNDKCLNFLRSKHFTISRILSKVSLENLIS